MGLARPLALVGSLVLAGCSAADAARLEAPVVALRVDAPVHAPVWSHNEHVLLALTEGSPRIAKIDPAGGPGSPRTARTTLSEPLPEVGENIATSPTEADVVFVPQPRLDRVAVVSVGDLRPVRTLRAGPAPSFVAEDSGSKVLLTMPEDGSSVTGVDLLDDRVLATREVLAGPEAEVDAGKRGRRIDYHVAGPRGIALYKGSPFSVEKKGEIALSAETSAGDLIKPSRLYAAQKGTGRLFAVDEKRSLHGLEVVARHDMGEPVRHIGVDEARIYAATERRLVVLETNSYEGYENNMFPHLDTIHFRDALQREELEQAPLSGLAVGPDRVYLTLKGQPYVISVGKPSI